MKKELEKNYDPKKVEDKIYSGWLEKGYFKALDRQKLDGNSDHYPFAQRKVPCIFFMNEGGDAFKYYHTVFDTWDNAIFSNYEPTFNLIKDFISKQQ